MNFNIFIHSCPKKYAYSLCRQFQASPSTCCYYRSHKSFLGFHNCSPTAFLAFFTQHKAFELTCVTVCIQYFIHPSDQNSIV